MVTWRALLGLAGVAALAATGAAYGADDPELAVMKGHRGGVLRVLFTPDGKRLLSLGTDGRVLAFDPASHKQIGTLIERGARSMTLSPDGKVLAVVLADSSVALRDPSAKGRGAVLKWHKEVALARFSPDGKMVATADRNHHVVKVWDATDGSELASIDAHSQTVYDLVFTGDGKRLISASRDKTIKVWDPKTGKRQRTIDAETNIMALAVPKGDAVVVGTNGAYVKTWDLTTGKELGRFGTTIGIVTSPPRVVVTKDQKSVAVLTGWNDVFLFELEGLKKQVYVRHDKLNDFDMDGEERLIAGAGSDGTVVIWDVSGAKEEKIRVAAKLKEHAKAVNSVAFSPDGKVLASGSDDGTIRLWDVAKAVAGGK